MCRWGGTGANVLLGQLSTSTHPKAEFPLNWLSIMRAVLTWLRISNICAQSSENLPRDLFGCWSRKWIFYSWLVWSITYKLLLYFMAHGKEVPGGRDWWIRPKGIWMKTTKRPAVDEIIYGEAHTFFASPFWYLKSTGIVAKQMNAFRC